VGLVTVNFECVDQEITPNPVGSVVIRVFETNDTYVTSFTSNPVTGIATGSLDGDASPNPHAYNIRIYKYGHDVTNPQAIEIYDPPAGSPTGTNDFTLTLDPHAAQAPADARRMLPKRLRTLGSVVVVVILGVLTELPRGDP
jgi:hypothetical protein